MEATGAAPARGSASDGVLAKLRREPLFWASAAAFLGVALGVFGMIRHAALWDGYYVDPVAQMLAYISGFLGDSLSMLSVLGIVYLLWGTLCGVRRRMVLLGTGLLSVLVAAEILGIAFTVYVNTGERWQAYAGVPFPAIEVAVFWATIFLPCAALLPFAVASFLGRERNLGLVVSGLFLFAVPYAFLWTLLFPSETYTEPSFPFLLFALGWYPAGVSLLEAPLWILLGTTFLRRARGSTLGEAFRVREKENLEAARRLYEEGLGRGDASVVDDLVSEDFRDLKRGSRGKLGMERVFSALWKSYPDLSVTVEDQRAEGDLVRTRLTLSGTDRGGVLWYPPTERQATFTAEFVDRFVEGLLIEHSGQADTGELLRQLGLTQAHAPSPSETQT
ncbi:MAG: ester cyclase [Rubrobacter sp.]